MEPNDSEIDVALEDVESTENAGRSTASQVIAAVGFAAATVSAGALGRIAMKRASKVSKVWYWLLRKPKIQPPSKVFPVVWSVLYGLIAFSGWRVWRAPASKERSRALGLWGAQLILNGMWTPLFFALRKPRLALLDTVALDAAATTYGLAAKKVDAAAAGAVVPYVGWLGFATALNTIIVAKNKKQTLFG